MATTTLLRTMGGVDDIRAGINSASLRRLLSIGSTWTQLRVGVRWCMAPGGANLQGKKIFIGVCSGTTNPWNNGAALTTHAVGWVSPSQADYPYFGGTAPNNYYNTGGYGRAAKRVGTTITYSGGYLGEPSYWPATTDNRAMMHFVTITKGSPNFTIATWAFQGTTGLVHATKEDLLQYVVLAAPSRSGYQGSSTALAVNEATDGYLNAVNIAFEGGINMEVSDVAIVRFA